ncbi:hypothetical protein SS50377_21841 [Spironucleus salmonicida]|uniref:Transmembrane protein n=1 Tax=Spironucleus salmonicida TaxID=348837 RepID=V6LIG9_9EUKA|nr:hypothetical protein SS50377_21841 [Spironucleus salmonicida]|eukprot:EST44385.1 Hypothetical protein SS50377_15688 [Spironucleus salmonicida]
MHVVLLALYSNVSAIDCYTQRSQLNLFINHLEIQFRHDPGDLCDFPRGVMVQLQFPDSALDIGQVFTNFSYENTNSLIINCGTKCADYDHVISSTVLIDSPQLTTLFSIGSVLNIRKKMSRVNAGVHLTVKDDITCMVIDQPNIGKNLADKQVILKIQSDRDGSTQYLNPTEEFNADNTQYCFKVNFSLPFVNTGILMLQGRLDGISISENYTSTQISIPNQPNIFTGLSATVFSSYIAIEFDRNDPEYDNFITSTSFAKTKFDLKINLNNTNYYIAGNFTKSLFENGGNIVCALSDNEADCIHILQLFKQHSKNEYIVTFYFQIDKVTIIKQVKNFYSTCFQTLNVIIRKSYLTFGFDHLIQDCPMIETSNYTFDLGYFHTDKELALGFSKFNSIKEFQKDYNSTKREINIQFSRNQFLIIENLKNEPYTVLYIFSADGKYLDQILADTVQVSLMTTYLFYVVVGVLSNAVICTGVFFITIMPKKKRSVVRSKAKVIEEL